MRENVGIRKIATTQKSSSETVIKCTQIDLGQKGTESTEKCVKGVKCYFNDNTLRKPLCFPA